MVTINNAGLRSLNSWNNNRKKIVFLGDSVTYGGSYIDDRDIFSHQVCLKLKDFIVENNKHEIIKFTKGYSHF